MLFEKLTIDCRNKLAASCWIRASTRFGTQTLVKRDAIARSRSSANYKVAFISSKFFNFNAVKTAER